MRTGMGACESGIEGAQEGGTVSQEACKKSYIDRGCAKGGTGSSCETGSGAGERNEAVGRVRAGVGAGASGTATRETRSGCGNWHNRRTGGSADKHHKAHLKHAIKHFM